MTSRSSEISVRVSETRYAVPSNRPSEKSFLITHVNDDGKVLSEMSVQHGLLVIPKSEFEALQKKQRKDVTSTILSARKSLLHTVKM